MVEDYIMWKQYGSSFPLRLLPAPLYQGHIAIKEGENIRLEEEDEKRG